MAGNPFRWRNSFESLLRELAEATILQANTLINYSGFDGKNHGFQKQFPFKPLCHTEMNQPLVVPKSRLSGQATLVQTFVGAEGPTNHRMGFLIGLSEQGGLNNEKLVPEIWENDD